MPEATAAVAVILDPKSTGRKSRALQVIYISLICLDLSWEWVDGSDIPNEILQFTQESHVPFELEKSQQSFCPDCLLNARCYNSTVSLWHPTNCGQVKQMDSSLVEESECFPKRSILYLGDSRLRILAGATAALMGDENFEMNSYAVIDDSMDREPNKTKDFWRYHFSEDVPYANIYTVRRSLLDSSSDKNDNGHAKENQLLTAKRSVSFVWNPFMLLEFDRVDNEFSMMEGLPTLVFSFGAWFLNRLTGQKENDEELMDKYEEGLIDIADNLMRVREKFHEAIFLLDFKPNNFNQTLDQRDQKFALRMREDSIRVLQHYPFIKIWDSHLANDFKYVELCHKYNYTSEIAEPTRMLSVQRHWLSWNCKDRFHPGLVVLSHVANLLLNHVCG